MTFNLFIALMLGSFACGVLGTTYLKRWYWIFAIVMFALIGVGLGAIKS